MTLAFLWENRRIIGEVAGLIAVGIIAWWAFWHNPEKIRALEAEKQELSRQVDAGKQALTLLNDIEKGKVRINAQVQAQISTVRAAAIPRRAVIIKPGGLLPALPATNPSN